MEEEKRPILSFRADEEIKEVLENLAKQEYRSLSRQLEKVVLEWLRDNKLLPKGHPKK